jgi:hypothetical protein
VSTYEDGDCFQVAADTLIYKHFTGEDEGWQLCHGQVVLTGGPHKGVQTGHAWLEQDGYVIDHSNGRIFEGPSMLYYAIGNITGVRRYSYDELKTKVLEYGHYGPWEDDDATQPEEPREVDERTDRGSAGDRAPGSRPVEEAAGVVGRKGQGGQHQLPQV